jgi:hypothetical protein
MLCIAIILVSCGFLSPQSSEGKESDFLLFRGILDRETYLKRPEEYKQVLLPPGSYGREIYIEKVAAFTIKLGEIKSISIGKTIIDPILEKYTKELIKSRGKGEYIVEDPYPYTITFTVTTEISEDFKKFLLKTKGEIFEIRFGGQILGIRKFQGSFEKDTFNLAITKEIANRIKGKYPNLVKTEHN